MDPIVFTAIELLPAAVVAPAGAEQHDGEGAHGVHACQEDGE